MTLKEKMDITVKELLQADENEKRYIKRNLQKEFNALDARGTIKILRLQALLAAKEVYLKEETIWFFMKIFASNKFTDGTSLFGTAMKKIANKYSSTEHRLENIINQKSIENPYAKTILLSQIRFLNSEKISLDLASLFADILAWNHENKLTQTKWINQYI